ncbi:E3 ubiquitin-protein ligase MBR2 [Eutrema salsugineum]|uniref:E3 ubiquitin-protein ligase MBR2 n=1 Tax=Eutrema salsugineum TaxID=72664 RepID=UPI000CED6203|nr:E3 ubiquitin-protein ligase MBR2 [Eutrema salsugineum]
MDQNGDSLPRSDSAFSFQRLLCGDDWHRWDTFPTVDVSANSSDPTTEMNHDVPTIESDPLLMELTREEAVEQWLQSLPNEQFDILSEEENIDLSSDEHTFTYEEFLELGDQIGNVCTGLDVESIDRNLSQRKYEECCGETEKCVICLCEFKYNDDVSKLGCGHEFHFECIKQWLMIKNMCPLCKQNAL